MFHILGTGHTSSAQNLFVDLREVPQLHSDDDQFFVDEVTDDHD